jgi:two-component system, OmpR family, response regulator
MPRMALKKNHISDDDQRIKKMETKKNILLVDDDYDQLLQMKMHLESAGFATFLAENSREGEDYIRANKPDLAIVDLMMENMDSGFVLSYKIKAKYPDVPVIIATAVSAETGLNFGLESVEEKHWIKADKYLDKGIRPDQLIREVNKLLNI